MEVWRDIENYEGYYQVSDWGRIRSLPRTIIHNNGGQHQSIGCLLKLSISKYGYLQAKLSKNGKSKKINVHKLVSQAFLDNTDSLPFIEHKDGIWTNNEATNLRWSKTRERR